MNEARVVVTLENIGADDDPGRAWHPKPSKFTAAGLLPDLDDAQVGEHLRKPEATSEPVLAAEDSTESPEGAI